MIKVLHFSDVHLGVTTHGKTDPRTGLSTRVADFLKSLDAIIEAALGCDLVIFAGDAYKTRSPSPTYQREFTSRIYRLSQAGIPTVLVTGNHDRGNVAQHANTLEIFQALEIENVYVSSTPCVLDIETRHGPVQVGVMPWIVRSSLLSHDDHKNRSLEEINELLLQRIETVFTGKQGLISRLREGVPHILVAHGTIQGATYGSERAVTLGKDIVVPLSLVKNPSWDYVALGHIHRHQEIEPESAPPVVYAGSIERIDFGEEKESKGFVIAEVERGKCTWKFHELDVRKFVTVRIDVHGENPTAQVVDAIKKRDIFNSVVEVVITTTAECAVRIRDKEVRSALKDAFYVAEIAHNIIREERMRLGSTQAVSSLTPIEAVEKYFRVKETPQPRIDVLMHHVEQLSQKLP